MTTATLPPPTVEAQLRALRDAHASMLMGFLLRLTFGDRGAAEDLLQETWLRAWQHLGELAPEPPKVRSWLMTVAYRLAIDRARAIKARPKEINNYDMVNMAAVGDPMEQVLNVQTVRQAVAKLSDLHRQVIVEIYLRGRRRDELAAELNVPEGTVKSRGFYALRELRRVLNAEVRHAA